MNDLSKFSQFEVSGNKVTGADYACYNDDGGHSWVMESDNNTWGDYKVFKSKYGGYTYCSAIY